MQVISNFPLFEFIGRMMLKENFYLEDCQKFIVGSSTSILTKSYVHTIELVLKSFIISLLSRLVRKNLLMCKNFFVVAYFFR